MPSERQDNETPAPINSQKHCQQREEGARERGVGTEGNCFAWLRLHFDFVAAASAAALSQPIRNSICFCAPHAAYA